MNSKLNSVFSSMKQRCHNPNNKNYNYYGARGITVCEEWRKPREGWLLFKEWALTNGYKEGLTIDRIDVNKGYSPENCRWVTMAVQNNNTRNNHLVTYMGETKTLREWCDKLGLRYKRVLYRINHTKLTVEQVFKEREYYNNRLITYQGRTQSLKNWCNELKLVYQRTVQRIDVYHWPIKKAFETKERVGLRLITYKGETLPLKKWSKRLGINYGTLKSRLDDSHWTVEKAFETKIMTPKEARGIIRNGVKEE